MFLNLFITTVFASQWLVKAPTANPQEFAVYAQNSQYEKISNFFLQCDARLQLNEDLKRAQILFLDGDLQQAKDHFSKVVEKKWSCDWADDERKIISFSFLRLAQMTPNLEAQKDYLYEAIQFDESFRPDEAIFPPPLVNSYKTLLQQLPRQKIVLPTFSKKFTGLLRNGRFLSLANLTLEAQSGKARYTFVSDSYQTEKYFISLTELSALTLEPQPLVYGDCDNMQVHESLKWQTELHVFFSLNCIKGMQQNSSLATQSLSSSPQMKELTASTEIPVQDAPKGSWLQRNGLWLGTAIVGSLLVSYHLKNQDKEQQVAVPTTTLHQ